MSIELDSHFQKVLGVENTQDLKNFWDSYFDSEVNVRNYSDMFLSILGDKFPDLSVNPQYLKFLGVITLLAAQYGFDSHGGLYRGEDGWRQKRSFLHPARLTSTGVYLAQLNMDTSRIKKESKRSEKNLPICTPNKSFIEAVSAINLDWKMADVITRDDFVEYKCPLIERAFGEMIGLNCELIFKGDKLAW